MALPSQMTAAVETPVPDEPNPSVSPQLPWASIPKFVPGTTHVQEYVQKMKFLASMWPAEHLSLLAPRAALLVEGTAFRKVARLDPEKLRVNDKSGVALLVDAIGGSWGATELEERYEYFEKALYGTVQRADESHDSYLSRMESNFIELLSRGTKLEEVQAYVLLRQSLLPPEDKKRVLLEHPGELKYDPVVRSFRLLGSKFFADVQGSRQNTKSKVYDVHHAEVSESDWTRSHEDASSERAFLALTEDHEADFDQEFLDIMIASEDQDALTVHNFEQEIEEFLQEVPEMHDAMVSYLEARSKLQEKRRTRGFWPVKFSGKDGKGAYKGKGRGKGKKQREQLLSRIARSTCRICHKKGHWKAECPDRDKSSELGQTALANIVEEAPLASVHEVLSEPESSPSADECESRALPAKCKFSCQCLSQSLSVHAMTQDVVDDIFVVQALHDPVFKTALGKRMKNLLTSRANGHVVSKQSLPRPPGVLRSRCVKAAPMNEISEPLPDMCNIAAACGRPSHAILDTGASRCVIGEKVWLKLFASLPEDLKHKVRKSPSHVKFRFGNNQTMQSEYQIQVPLQSAPQAKKKLWLTVEVLPGQTPFLFSKRAFKQLGGILDTANDTCYLQRLNRSIQLELNPTELYLLDVLQLCASNVSFFKKNAHIHHVWGVRSKGSDPTQGIQDGESQVENISLTMAKPVSKDFQSPEPVSSNRADIHAACAHDEFVEDGGRSPDWSSHDATAVFDTSTGSTAGGPRGSTRSDADNGKYGARTAKSEKSAAEPHVVIRSPTTPRPNFKWCYNRSRSLQFTNAKDSTGLTASSSASSSGQCPREHCPPHNPGDQLAGSSRERGGRGDPRCRRSSSGCESFNCESRQCPWNPRPQHITSDDGRGMGTVPNHMGKEAQGSHICSGPSVRPRVFPMVSSEIPKFAPKPTRFREVLSSAVGPGLTCHLGSDSGMKTSASMYHDEVSRTKQFLAKSQPPKLLNDDLQASFHRANLILEDAFVSPTWSAPQRQCVLLEVYADSLSPLTEALRQSGHFALRFTRQDGDLSTVEGRKKLWQIIDKYQPLNIWVAPECGPWGGWSKLNMCKSVALFDRINAWRKRELIHVDLCAQLCKFQVQRRRHFHLEQPNGSTMPKIEQFQDILSLTHRASFDMCQFGLKHPVTKFFLRKSSQVFSTNMELVNLLGKARCKHHHVHQPIEGSVSVDGQHIPLTRFCATYCSGFARQVAKWIVQSTCEDTLVGEHEDSPPAKRSRFMINPNKRLKTKHVIDLDSDSVPEIPDVPMPEPSQPEEKPEMFQSKMISDVSDVVVSKQNRPVNAKEMSQAPRPNEEAASPVSELWRPVFQLMETVAPRVGNLRIDASHEAARRVQAMLPHLNLQVIYVCRGTERFQLPLDLPDRNHNSIRHTVCIHRSTGSIYDFGFEDWLVLKRAQRIRTAVPSKLMITSFGTLVEEPKIHAEEVAKPSASLPSFVPEARGVIPRPVPREDAEIRASRFQPLAQFDGWAPPPQIS